MMRTAEHFDLYQVSIPSNLEQGWQKIMLNVPLDKKYLAKRHDTKDGDQDRIRS